MARKGSYAKGLAKREEILTTALEVIAREGFSGTSVRQLADAVGLSQAGVLHYFDSKDELFTEVLRKRDETDMGAYGHVEDAAFDDLLTIVRHNAEVPGLVQLYTHMSTAATDPSHPSHGFFQERTKVVLEGLTKLLTAEKEAGHLFPEMDPAQCARMLIALLDGLQTQWLLDRRVDMAGDIAAFLAAIGIRTGSPPA